MMSTEMVNDLCAGEYQTAQRMKDKLRAIPIPSLMGKFVLDIGCDHGFWSFLSERSGAGSVLGLDRGRYVKGVGYVDLVSRNRKRASELGLEKCSFQKVNLGEQWKVFGNSFDVIFMFSLYHHIFEQCGSHQSIWFWLRQHCHSSSEILWENPVDDSDSVVQRNVSRAKIKYYTEKDIRSAAEMYFNITDVGPAIHEKTRVVWKLTPKPLELDKYTAQIKSGAGGASKAFSYMNFRRVKEFKHAVGVEFLPGSLNLVTHKSFDWNSKYYRVQILDVVNRKKGLDSRWEERWGRLYPVSLSVDYKSKEGYVFRFEGESYPDNFVEVLSDVRLRDTFNGNEKVVLKT